MYHIKIKWRCVYA